MVVEGVSFRKLFYPIMAAAAITLASCAKVKYDQDYTKTFSIDEWNKQSCVAKKNPRAELTGILHDVGAMDCEKRIDSLVREEVIKDKSDTTKTDTVYVSQAVKFTDSENKEHYLMYFPSLNNRFDTLKIVLLKIFSS